MAFLAELSISLKKRICSVFIFIIDQKRSNLNLDSVRLYEVSVPFVFSS